MTTTRGRLELPEETRSLTEAYLTEFAASGVSASAVVEQVRPSTDDTTFLGRTLSRPCFLEKSAIDRLAADIDHLHTAVTGLPDRVFGGDMAAFARAVGATERQAQVVLRGRASRPSRMGRADFYLDHQGFHLMEINWGAALGGLDSAILNRAMQDVPVIGEFVQRHQLGYVDPMVELVHTLFTECGVAEGTRPAVALADWPDSFATLEPSLRKNVADYARFGIDAFPCHVGQLSYSDGQVWLADQRIDVIYRLFLMEDLLTPQGPALIEPVLQAAERGEVAIFSPMDADLYGSKGALALLSDEQFRDRYQPAELASLDRILPWTRMVRPGPVTVAGRTVDLTEFAMAAQQELVLKPTMMHGGIGVVPGWSTSPAEWRSQLAAAMDEPCVLQQRIRGIPEPFPSPAGPDSGDEEWTMTWGVFMTYRGYGGMFMRGSRDPDTTVNMRTGATGTSCFHQVRPD